MKNYYPDKFKFFTENNVNDKEINEFIQEILEELMDSDIRDNSTIAKGNVIIDVKQNELAYEVSVYKNYAKMIISKK